MSLDLDICEYRGSLLGAMDYIHRVCEENGIKNYLMGGTLLGAVRHGGFIPGDDDIDIALSRSEYEQFCKVFRECSNGRYRLVAFGCTEGYYLPMAKIIDSRFLLREHVSKPIDLGPYVDIFPLDNCPGRRDEAVSFANSIKPYRMLLSAKNSRLRSPRPIPKQIILGCVKFATAPVTRAELLGGGLRHAA